MFAAVTQSNATHDLGFGLTSPSAVSVCSSACGNGYSSSLGYYAAGTQLVFTLTDNSTGQSFASTDAQHAQIKQTDSRTWQIGWDDAVGDGDFDDLITVVTSDPNALSLTERLGLSNDLMDRPTCTCGDPVDNGTGNLAEQVTDLSVSTTSAAGFPASETRSYNSMGAASKGRLGYGWTDEWGWFLSTDPGSGSVTVTEGHGATGIFTPDGSGGYVADGPVMAKLETIAGGGWKLTRFPHNVYTFDAAGRLTSKSSLSGVVTTLTYSANGQLQTVTDPNGRTLTFAYNSDGYVGTVTGPSGRVVTYTYSAAGDLTKVVDPAGASTVMTYDGVHRLLTLTDPRGKVTTTGYDTSGRVSTQTIPGRGTLTWDYQTPGSDGTATTTVTDSRNNKNTFTYTGTNLVATTIGAGSPAAATTTYTYFPAQFSYSSLRPERVTDPNGNSTDYDWETHGDLNSRRDPNGRTTYFIYDANDNLLSTQVKSVYTHYNYDSNNLLTSATDQLGLVTSYTYSSRGEVATTTTPAGRITTNAYDAGGNLASVTSPASEKTTYTSNPSGWITAKTSPRGNIAGATVEDFTSHYTFDADGRQTSATDPRDTTTTTTYDADGNPLEDKTVSVSGTVLSDLTRTFDPAGQLLTLTNVDHTERTNSYDAVGNLATTADGSGATTSYTYDSHNRRATMTTARGNVAGATAATKAAYTWTYGYDGDDNLTSTTDPTGRVTATAYDSMNKPTKVTTPLGNSTTTTYDQMERPSLVTNPLGASVIYNFDDSGRLTNWHNSSGTEGMSYAYDPDGLVASANHGGSNLTTYTYDSDGRVITKVDPLGNVSGGTPANYTTTYGYDADGNQTSVKDQLGRTTTSTYDANGQQLTSKTPLGSTTVRTYDGLGRVTSVTDPDSRATQNTYNKYGDLTTRTDPQNHTIGYAYDHRHLLTSITDQLSRTRTFSYDPDGNLTSKVAARGTATGATAATWTVNQTFDARDLRTGISNSADPSVNATFSYDGDGRMTQFVDITGTTNLGYDNAAQLTSAAGPDGTYSYAYNPDGTISQRTLPAEGAISYTYTLWGRHVASQTANSQTTKYAYDANEQLTTLTYPSSTGLVETRGYDRTGAMNKVLNKKGSTVLSQYDYTLDNDGNPTAIKTTRGTTATTDSYTYDPAEQITKYCPGATTCTSATKYVGYTYDPLGDMTQQARVGVTNPGTTTNSYDNAGERTSSKAPSGTVTSYTYDADGNLTSGGRTWDALDRMTAIGTGSSKYTIAYNPFGLRRSLRPASGNSTTYSWDMNNPLPQIGVLSRPDGTTWTNRYDPTGWIQAVRASGQTYADSYLLHDRLGSITDVAGTTSGTAEWSYSYEPFGTSTTTKVNTAALDTRFGFGGQMLEPATNEYNLRARDYSQTDAGFHSVDPLAIDPSSSEDPSDVQASAYIYAANNPMLFTDPTGLSPGTCQAAQAVSGILNVLNIDQGSVCDFGSGGAQAVADLGGGIVNGLSPSKAFTDFYDQHVGADSSSCFYKTTSAATFAGSFFVGSGDVTAGVKTLKELEAAEHAADSGVAASHAAGQLGEHLAGVVKNTEHIPSASGTAAYRVPDELNANVLGEVKNVSQLSLTAQLRDFLSYATENGLQFNLYVREGTKLSGPLQEAVDSGLINLVRSLP